jgi:hypothetical protein
LRARHEFLLREGGAMKGAGFIVALLAPIGLAHGAKQPAITNGPAIALMRYACLGPCPAYSVTVDGDGHITYMGESNTGALGVRTAKIDAADYAELVRSLSALTSYQDSYQNESDGCEERWTDHSHFMIALHSATANKQVRVDLGCEGKRVQADIEALTKLAKRIDDSLSTDRWTSYSTQTGGYPAGMSEPKE